MSKNCPYCNSMDLEAYYAIKNLPIILSACPYELLEKMKVADFEATLCKHCGLGFNSKPLDDEDLKLIYDNYIYISPLHQIGHTRYIETLDLIEQYIQKDEKIVEIGCSEGYVLYNLKQKDYTDLLGIEPGPQAKIAKELQLPIIQDYFQIDTFEQSSIDCFILMHVLEHFPDPFAILKSMKTQLKSNGKIIIEVPNFYGYYHEHLYFYNSFFIHKMAKKMGLKVIYETINDKKLVLRFILTHNENSSYQEVESRVQIDDIIKLTKQMRENFEEKTKQVNQLLCNKKELYWWGAGSASIIYLNQLDKKSLQNCKLIILDGDKSKWNTFIPNLHFKVQSFETLCNQTIQNLVIASSFYEEIKQTLLKNNIKVENIEIFQ